VEEDPWIGGGPTGGESDATGAETAGIFEAQGEIQVKKFDSPTMGTDGSPSRPRTSGPGVRTFGKQPLLSKVASRHDEPAAAALQRIGPSRLPPASRQ